MRRSLYSWDIVIRRVEDKLILDKRDGSCSADGRIRLISGPFAAAAHGV